MNENTESQYGKLSVVFCKYNILFVSFISSMIYAYLCIRINYSKGDKTCHPKQAYPPRMRNSVILH